MEEKVLVSVVITAYNVAEWLEEAVRSAINQSYGNIEVVVVEDCSTDNGKTVEVIKKLQEEYKEPQLKVVWNEKNVGAGLSRRYGIQNTIGEYVLLLDGDDWLGEDFIQALMDGGDNADIIGGGITQLTPNGDYRITMHHHREETGALEKIKAHFNEGIVFLNNKLVRRSLYDKVPYSSRRFIEDTPTIVPLLYLAKNVIYVENAGYFYRYRQESLSHGTNEIKTALFRGLCVKDLINFFSDKPHEHRLMFKHILVLELGRLMLQHPKEEVEKVMNQYKEEWEEFIEYLYDVQTLLRSFIA